MRVLDLFSGLGGWGAAFRDRGHDVTSIDYEPRFGSSLVLSVMDIKALNGWDVILASPPCECFSVMTIGKNWNKDRTPKTERAAAALDLARHTFALIEAAKPKWYVVENPRGMLRKVAPQPPNATTWYCRWGMPYAKPTDLWTNLNGGAPIGWPICSPGGKDHPAAPRGASAGVQWRNWNPRSPEPNHIDAARVSRGVGGPDVQFAEMIARSGGFGSGFARDMTSDELRAEIERRTGIRLVGTPRGGNHDMVRGAFRALIPYPLSEAVAIACETDGVVRPPLAEVA